MSFLDIIDHFSSGDSVGGQYTVNRYAKRVGDSKGRLAAKGTATTLLVQAGIQPTTGREQEVLIEMSVTSESKKVFTEIPLQTRRPGQEPDEIIIKGEVYVTYTCSVWEGFDEVAYVSLVARKEQS